MNKTEKHKEICRELNEIYAAKNDDYGDSFAETRVKYPDAIVIRLTDKVNRLGHLIDGADPKVPSESITDTLMDIANYAIMEIVERGGSVAEEIIRTCEEWEKRYGK